jgi:hypothetical protein
MLDIGIELGPDFGYVLNSQPFICPQLKYQGSVHQIEYNMVNMALNLHHQSQVHTGDSALSSKKYGPVPGHGYSILAPARLAYHSSSTYCACNWSHHSCAAVLWNLAGSGC